MKIAVTHKKGQIFQHFGHIEQFKVYTVEDGKIIDSTDHEHGECEHKCGDHDCGLQNCH